MSRIGIMGGTFNPIHNGHVQIAQSAYVQYHLDEVWFMPNHIPAYKETDQIVSGQDRLAMTALAIYKIPYFRVSDYELRRDGNTYTYETLQGLTREYPDNTFYFIMGADSLMYFDRWVHPEQIVKLTQIIVAARDHSSDKQLQGKIQELEELYGRRSVFHLVECAEIACSSSRLREELCQAKGQPTSYIRQYLNPDVWQYIKDNRLYI